MRPDDFPAEGGVAGIQEMSPADLLITLRTPLRDNQITCLGRQDEALSIIHTKNIRAALLLAAVALQCAPQALPRLGLDAHQLAIAGGAIDVAIFNKRRPEDAIKAVFLGVATPRDFGAGLI